MTKVIVGVSGFAGSGKDTFADRLVERHGFLKISLADPIKEVCKRVFDFTDEQLWGSSNKREEEDLRYPFSGICPACHQRCKSQPRPEDDHNDWRCPTHGGYKAFVTPRLALQTLGTEWGRTLYGDIWIDTTVREIQRSIHDRWVVPDVRFHNEVRKLRDAGAWLVRLKRGEQRYPHASEAQMAEMKDGSFDLSLNNHGTLEELYQAVDRFTERL